jgi:hypothetical protein
MKKLLVTLAFLPLYALSQTSSDSTTTPVKKRGSKFKEEVDNRPKGRNLVKTNLSSIPIKNYHFTLERGINKKMSIALSYRFMPSGHIPAESIVKNLIDNDDVDVTGFTMSNHAITPEFRYYLGKGTLAGVYLSAYARFAKFDVSVPLRYTYQEGSVKKSEKVNLVGDITSTSGGLMIGSQFNLGKHMVLDIWIIGAHFGGSKGNINGSFGRTLSQADQQTLLESLRNTNTNPFSFEYTVTSNNVKVDATGPWAGVRAAGLNFGFRF